MTDVDVNVVGSGPNGLAAAVTLARAGLSVRVYERSDTIGGGSRTAELTLPGFRHDVCSAVHPQALVSRFFRAFELTKRVPFSIPEASYAHPLDGSRAGIAYRDLDRTVEGLGRDGPAWRALFGPLLGHVRGIEDFSGSQLLRIPRDVPGSILLGLRVLEQGTPAWNARFAGDGAPAMLTGVMAHASSRLPSLGAAGVGMVLATYAHATGWGIPIGGAQAIADAMADDIRAHGGEIVTGCEVGSLDELPTARATLLDTSPRALDTLAGARLPDAYRHALRRFSYGTGVAKVDFALSDPVPWANAEVALAGTVHLGGTRESIAASEAGARAGRFSDQPFVLVAQPTLFDDSRAPAGRHVVWAYTHVPSGSGIDATEVVTAQLERSAPGFRDTILASSAMSAAEVAEHNPNYVGGDITGGSITVPQLLRRPVLSPVPWKTPMPGVYLCSSSTPPGPAVHGMNGWYAARAALRSTFGVSTVPRLGVR